VGNFGCPSAGKRTKEERLDSESDELREGKGDSHFFVKMLLALFLTTVGWGWDEKRVTLQLTLLIGNA
jgi:hypothetical protein